MSAGRGIRERRGVASPRRAALAAAALTLVVVVAVWFAGKGVVPAAAPRQQFLAAGRAYDEGRMREAVRLYEDLLRAGHVSMEVFFNLGNAEAGDGRLGAAVLNYRKAWRLAPRDPDVGANLRLALQATGASEADLSGAELVFTRLSEREWAIAAMTAWWATCLVLSLAILFRSRRWFLVRLGALPAAIAVAAVLGLWTWRGFERAPELVVLNDTQNALRAPQASATPHFSLPEGSLVRAREYRGEWVRVSYGQLSGWIRGAAGAPVLLAAPPK
jgi:tetratricopeptide (TPR) repeat protein